MEQLTNNSIIWAAGENSGDYLASRVLPAVAASRPNLKMEGIGGDRMIHFGRHNGGNRIGRIMKTVDIIEYQSQYNDNH